MADDAEAEADPGILSRWIYYKTYCGEDGNKRTYVVHTPKADLLQAGSTQHKRCNREGIKMTDLRKAAERAMEVLTDYVEDPRCQKEIDEAAEALRQALAEEKPWVKTYCGGKPNYTTPEQEFVVWMVDNAGNKYEIPEANKGPLLKAMERKWVKKSRRRKWVELVDEDIQSCPSWCGDQHDFAYEIEAKLKEKNAGA